MQQKVKETKSSMLNIQDVHKDLQAFKKTVTQEHKVLFKCLENLDMEEVYDTNTRITPEWLNRHVVKSCTRPRKDNSPYCGTTNAELTKEDLTNMNAEKT